MAEKMRRRGEDERVVPYFPFLEIREYHPGGGGKRTGRRER
jgi:hypothetical protein